MEPDMELDPVTGQWRFTATRPDPVTEELWRQAAEQSRLDREARLKTHPMARPLAGKRGAAPLCPGCGQPVEQGVCADRGCVALGLAPSSAEAVRRGRQYAETAPPSDFRTGRSALAYLDAQAADPAEARDMARERERARLGRQERAEALAYLQARASVLHLSGDES